MADGPSSSVNSAGKGGATFPDKGGAILPDEPMNEVDSTKRAAASAAVGQSWQPAWQPDDISLSSAGAYHNFSEEAATTAGNKQQAILRGLDLVKQQQRKKKLRTSASTTCDTVAAIAPTPPGSPSTSSIASTIMSRMNESVIENDDEFSVKMADAPSVPLHIIGVPVGIISSSPPLGKRAGEEPSFTFKRPRSSDDGSKQSV
eukprot:scaffold48493_cov54-Attheya_sp.AAC.3